MFAAVTSQRSQRILTSGQTVVEQISVETARLKVGKRKKENILK